jgi:hypothetical protein
LLERGDGLRGGLLAAAATPAAAASSQEHLWHANIYRLGVKELWSLWRDR